MKNKKGFTLVELLSVIILLGIIITIGIFSVSSIRKIILDRQYTNVKTSIELAAEKYYQDTESEKVYVGTLISEGYIKADNKSMIITDPRDKSPLNCFIVEITSKKATLKEYDYAQDDLCLDMTVSNNSLRILTSDGKTIKNDWYNNAFDIKADIIGKDNDNYNFSWRSELNPNIISTEQIFNLKNLYNERGNIIDDEFTVTAVANDNSETLDSEGTRIRIDGVPPVINNIDVPDQSNWAKSREVTISMSDIGSGIYSYIASKDDCLNGNYDDWNKLDDTIKNKNDVQIKYIFTENGTYYFCASDKAGNIVKYEDNIVISKIDTTPPTCAYNSVSLWTNQNREIGYGCEDKESGCKRVTLKVAKSSSSYYRYATSSTQIKQINCNSNTCYLPFYVTSSYKTANVNNLIGTFIVEDKVGNTRECPLNNDSINIYVDKDRPIVGNLTVKSRDSYNSIRTKVSFTINDDSLSGIVDYVCLGPESSNCSNYLVSRYCTSAGSNKYNCEIDYNVNSYDGSGESKLVYVSVDDKAGNTGASNVSYTLYKWCEETNFDRYGDYGECECSNPCNVGVATRDVLKYDKYLDPGKNSSACWTTQPVPCVCNSNCSNPDPDPDPDPVYPDPGDGDDDCPISEPINADRCYGNTKYHITYCQYRSCTSPQKCEYDRIDGKSSYGTISPRSELSKCSGSSTGGGDKKDFCDGKIKFDKPKSLCIRATGAGPYQIACCDGTTTVANEDKCYESDGTYRATWGRLGVCK